MSGSGSWLGHTGELVWSGSALQIAVAVALSVLIVGMAMLGHRSLRARMTEISLLSLGLIGIVVMVARPAVVERNGREEAGRIVLLVDASRSMSVLGGEKSRSELAQQVVNHLSGPDVDIYHFGTDLVVGPPSEFDLNATNIEAALHALKERVAGEQLGGVALVTDGLDRGPLRESMLAGDEAPDLGLSGPLTVYTVGEETAVKDVSVRSVDSGGFAFLRTPFEVSFEIGGTGFVGAKIPVTLERSEHPISTVEVEIGDDGKGRGQFVVTPSRVGSFSYQVSVPQYREDVIPQNNTTSFVVRVVRDKLRVLQVAGSPSWDVKVLRRFLKGDPSVDLVAFFILRTPPDMDAGYRDDELSLIPFPYERLFSDELWSFDLVIFQNFDYLPYFGDLPRDGIDLLENIHSFVSERGHGFIMVGGDRSFDLGDYAQTPIADLLPMRLGAPEPAVVLDAFNPTLTEAGQRHPVTRLVSDADQNAKAWVNLHPLDGANKVLGLAKGADALLTHPTEIGDDGAPMPVLAVKEVGRGRTMALTADASWRWSLSEAGEGHGNQSYMRFWKGAMRWLAQDPSSSRVDVTSGTENYRLGEEVRLVVTARRSDFEPLEGATVNLAITNRGESVMEAGVTDAMGEAVLMMTPTATGAHDVAATVTSAGGDALTTGTVFAVTTRDPELDEVAPDHSFGAWLTAYPDGRHHRNTPDGDMLLNPEAGRTVWSLGQVELWRHPVLAVVIMLSLGLSWLVRRRSGLS